MENVKNFFVGDCIRQKGFTMSQCLSLLKILETKGRQGRIWIGGEKIKRNNEGGL